MNTTPRPLLPETLKRPLMLLWLWVIPQAVLLLLNLRAWRLASGEATVEQARVAAGLGAAWAGLFAAGLALWLAARLRRRTVGLVACLAGLLLCIGYLWFFLARFDQAWPRAVAEWMLPRTELVFYQFALVMPALFYCGLRLACVELPLRRGRDIGLSLALFGVVPFAWYVLFHVVEVWAHRFLRGSMEAVAIVFFTGSTVLVTMAFLRLLYFLYAWLAERSWGVTAMTALSGWLFPLLGLLLNIKIPFPCDFQSVGVYVLTALNGAVLVAPLPRRAGLAALTWWARSALYLFTLYFFLVFLPFLPLSLLAMIVAGSGFLILAPTLLFVIHTRRLAADGAALAARIGRGRVRALFLAGLVTLPAGFVARAWIDRQALTAAMDAVFSPDLRRADVVCGPRAVSRALHGLRDMKDGIYLPFISDAYNRLVFNGMVLPDDKMDTLSRALLGKPSAAPKKAERFSLFLAPRAAARGGGGANRAVPPRQVALQPPAIEAREVSNGVLRCTVKLELRNTGPANSEFVGAVAIPDGLLVSGFWLDVAGARKPGAIVEKKTALWVYHMIRDYTRRDPGLLVYEGAGVLKLSVFPFAAGETRTVWLEFTGPLALQPSVLVNATPVPLAAGPAAAAASLLAPAAGAYLVPGAVLAALPRVDRTPVVHLILDRSAAAATNETAIPAALRDAVARFGARCRVTVANVASVDAAGAPAGFDRVDDLARAAATSLPARGGFVPDRAMARLLLAHAAAEGVTVPVFVVVPAPRSAPVRTLDLAPFARLVPDAPAYYLWATDRLERVAFETGARERVENIEGPKPAVVFRAAGRTTAVLPAAPAAVIDLQGAAERAATAPAVFNPAAGGFEAPPLAPARLDDARYAAGLRLLLDSGAASCDPAAIGAGLAGLVDRSRAAGVLCPFTSFIVVENTAQEKTLAAKQKQRLGAHHALEFEEPSVQSPEPGLLWLLPVALLVLWRARRSGPAGCFTSRDGL